MGARTLEYARPNWRRAGRRLSVAAGAFSLALGAVSLAIQGVCRTAAFAGEAGFIAFMALAASALLLPLIGGMCGLSGIFYRSEQKWLAAAGLLLNALSAWLNWNWLLSHRRT